MKVENGEWSAYQSREYVEPEYEQIVGPATPTLDERIGALEDAVMSLVDIIEPLLPEE